MTSLHQVLSSEQNIHSEANLHYLFQSSIIWQNLIHPFVIALHSPNLKICTYFIENIKPHPLWQISITNFSKLSGNAPQFLY